jgi:hypothetical protein
MSKKQIWMGGMMILAGINLFLGSQFGFAIAGPLYTIGAGVLMILAPWSDNPAHKRNFRIGGFWTILAGVAALVTYFGIHGVYGPLFLAGAGVAILMGLNEKEA